jgi:putative ABC transport system ATP-binding protein
VNFIEFVNVSKSYKSGEIRTLVLKEINFTVEEGEFVVLLGKSGSGKSTLLNILGGMDRATTGKVYVDGKNIAAYSDKAIAIYRRDKVGFVFQSYNLIAGLTALENIELGAEVVKNHFDPYKTLVRVGLKDKSKSFPSQLSGGEQQRVAVARALVKNPLVLLCDEPTGALDDTNGKMILSLLETINVGYQKTVILITHNSLIAPIADKIIVLSNGMIDSVKRNKNKMPVRDLMW